MGFVSGRFLVFGGWSAAVIGPSLKFAIAVGGIIGYPWLLAGLRLVRCVFFLSLPVTFLLGGS